MINWIKSINVLIKMIKRIKTHCPDCKKHTTHVLHALKKSHKSKARKIDFSQFDIKLKDKSKIAKILKKAVQNQHIAVLRCHICNKKQSVECHVVKK